MIIILFVICTTTALQFIPIILQLALHQHTITYLRIQMLLRFTILEFFIKIFQLNCFQGLDFNTIKLT